MVQGCTCIHTAKQTCMHTAADRHTLSCAGFPVCRCASALVRCRTAGSTAQQQPAALQSFCQLPCAPDPHCWQQQPPWRCHQSWAWTSPLGFLTLLLGTTQRQELSWRAQAVAAPTAVSAAVGAEGQGQGRLSCLAAQMSGTPWLACVECRQCTSTAAATPPQSSCRHGCRRCRQLHAVLLGRQQQDMQPAALAAAPVTANMCQTTAQHSEACRGPPVQ